MLRATGPVDKNERNTHNAACRRTSQNALFRKSQSHPAKDKYFKRIWVFLGGQVKTCVSSILFLWVISEWQRGAVAIVSDFHKNVPHLWNIHSLIFIACIGVAPLDCSCGMGSNSDAGNMAPTRSNQNILKKSSCGSLETLLYYGSVAYSNQEYVGIEVANCSLFAMIYNEPTQLGTLG